jgi:uncharacterized membrane protein YjdF
MIEAERRARAERIHLGTLVVLQVLMLAELAVLVRERAWLNMVLVLIIMGITLSPAALGRRFRVYIPPEFQVLAVVFVFASLFLGEVRSFYLRFWWWDIALHASSGLLLGILGFLLVYVLNEHERVDLHMQPHFVAFFAFVFAVAMGAVWEIFEFSSDQLLGTNMQKPMLGDPSGLTDTMWDLVVDTLGAAAIAVLGWWYTTRGRGSFLETWIERFVEMNPRLFRS